MLPIIRLSRFYVVSGALLVCTWLWILFSTYLSEHSESSVCIIKSLTDVPCPGCGTTRSIISVLRGQWADAFWLNPLGILVVFVLVVGSLMWLYDMVFSRFSLRSAYNKIERYAGDRRAVLLILGILLANWYWNIIKGL